MSYRLVETRPDQDERTIEVGGRTYLVPSVVEDTDGLRLLLLAENTLSVDLWTWAAQHGVGALVNIEAMTFVLTHDFAEHHSEVRSGRGLSLDPGYWSTYEIGMPYIEMVGRVDPGEAQVMAREGYGEPDLGRFVHLHTHSEFSALDGLTPLDDMVRIVTQDGQKAVAVTDHGVCAAHPALQLAADKAGIRPIFGMEANFVEDRHEKGVEVRGAYCHLILWAMNDEGLRNLWALSTEGFREECFYDRPRIDWEVLERHNEGLMCSTACERGPVTRYYLEDDEERALGNLGRLRAIFGDRLYGEIHTNGRAETRRANEWLVGLSTERDLPLVAVTDSHYGCKGDQHTHRVWLNVQTQKELTDDQDLFGGACDYHLMTADEVAKSLDYLPEGVVAEAMANTVRVAARCTAKIVERLHKPTFSKPTAEHPDPIEHDVERLWEIIEDRWEARIPADGDQDEYLDRVEREMRLLISKGFCGYFLMVADLINWAKDHGILVGPGRGSGGGSLVAYLTRITEIDPVAHNLLFERFMTEGREALPDFDSDFPSSKKTEMFDYVRERWGVENVAIVGTHMRLKSKGVLNDIARVLQSQLPENYYVDFRAVAKIVDEAEASTAGLGLSWDELWAQVGEELAPYRDKYPQVFDLADELRGRLKSYGTHPAGVIVSTEGPILGSLPLRKGGEGAPMVTQFDMEALERLGFVKIDLLNIRTLDTLQDCVDMIEAQTGERIDVYTWRSDREHSDPQVWEEISQGWTLGMFQIETTSGTRLTRRFKPANVAELADVITLVRPGPMRSGLTEQYFRRRSGAEEVTYPDPRLEPVLIKTYGTMLYQEDIMQICMVLAGYDSNEADEVRKILGKKKVDKVAAAGQKFIARAVANGTDPEVAEQLWEQMAEFARYAFNRAHAFAYALLGLWTAWFKVHYPLWSLCALLSTVKAERIPEFVEEARRLGYKILPPDVNLSGPGFTVSTEEMAVRYGLLSVKGIGEAAVTPILANQPYASWDDFVAKVRVEGTKCNAGHVKTLTRIGAFDSLVPHRRHQEHLLALEEVKSSDRCRHRTVEPVWITGPNLVKDKETKEPIEDRRELPCSYDWSAEPREPSKQPGRFKPGKPLPAKCSRACRRFDQLPAPGPEEIEPYTDEDIRRIEIETLGVFLSSTPFDRIPPEDLEGLSTAMEIQTAGPGVYVMAAMIKSVRAKPGGDRNGRAMGWVTLTSERGGLDAVVFNSTWDRYRPSLVPGRLIFAAIKSTNQGYQLDELVDLDES